jgi:hypothetical protein
MTIAALGDAHFNSKRTGVVLDGGNSLMNSGVRIVKRGTQRLKDLKPDHDEKTIQQGQREIVETVKGWIAELKLRRLAEESRCAAYLNAHSDTL